MSSRAFEPFINPVVRQFEAYVPGRSIAEIREAYGINRVIKLASNENPLGVSPAVREVLRQQAGFVFRYPQSGNPRLVKSIAEFHRVDPVRVFVSNGSDELLDLLFRVCAMPGVHNVVTALPCFGIYTTQARFAGVELRQAPLRKDFTVDLDAMLALADKNTTLVFLTSPDNPSGLAIPKEEILRFAASLPTQCMLVADQAYVDFAREEDGGEDAFSLIPELKAHSNIAVVRTFSKSRGLAGLRLGYGILPADLASYLWRVRLPFSVNSLAEEAGIAAIKDVAFWRETVRTVELGRRQLEQGLLALGCNVVPSHANFISFCHPGVENAGGINEALLKQGVIVRWLKSYGLPKYIRVTVGTEEENTIFLDALKVAFATF